MRAILFCVLVIGLELLPMTQAKGKRIVNFTPCKRRILEPPVLRLPGCPIMHSKYRIYGCYGYCASESITSLTGKQVVNNCKCCKVTEERKYSSVAWCGGRYRKFTFVSAIRCDCRKCSPKPPYVN